MFKKEENVNKHSDIIKNVSSLFRADIILYSGEITMDGAEQIVDMTAVPSNKNALFILCTPGGDPNAAFKIARRLQDQYERFYLYVHGYCKSAGTFIAIGSDEIIMGDFAEFGPLDVQLSEENEIQKYSSGLNINEALVNLKHETRLFFRQMLIELTAGAGLSTKMAAEIASKLSIDFFSPIVAQIEPLKIAKTRRALTIATAYGERLLQDGRGNLKSPEALAMLVEGYPDHGFVIDFKEAKKLFKVIKKDGEKIKELGESLSKLIKYPDHNSTIINKLYPNNEENNEEISNEPIDKPEDTRGVGKSKGSKGSQDPANSGESVPTERARHAA